MAVAAVTCLLEQVKEVEIWYKDLISGSEDEFKQLHNDLSLMKAFLKEKAEHRLRNMSDVLSELERQFTEVLYEMQENIDTCLWKAMRGKGRIINLNRFRLEKEVESIRKNKLRPLLEEVNRLADWQKFPERSVGEEDPQTEIRIRKDTPIRQNRIVGFDDQEAIIIDYLLKDTDFLDVIPIIGIPGQGKTTLAWKIFQNGHVDYHFPVRIWVCVSQKFNSRDVFLTILEKFMRSEGMIKLGDQELAQTVRMCLEREKFLLVLDDIWSVDAWNRIKQVLPLSNGKGKVLLTSRDNVVGMHSTSHEKPHKLRFLTEEESWTLLQYEVFGELDACPPKLAPIGRNIALKCDGLPLQIAVIGGILRGHLARGRATKGWEEVSRSVNDALQDDEEQVISRLMESSYNELPYDMRDCFIYMGIFPEDYEVPVQMLLRLWIAEGFIESKGRRTLEERGEKILNDLIRRNLLKAEKTNHMGKVKTCRIHDMVRAFCINKSKEQNLFGEMKMSDTGEFPPAFDVQNFRRLCLSSNLSKFLSELPDGSHARSFMCFYKESIELEARYTSALLSCFPRLRILESKSVKFHEFPAKVSKLIHLRYLTLFVDALAFLPESISQLWNLQTLVVETKTRSITMKANMWRMFQLRHLKTKAAIVLDSKWNGEAGQNLQTLNRLSPDSCTESVSKRAKNLKTLGISGKLANIFKTNFFKNLQQLEKLELVNSLAYEPTSEDLLLGLPQPNCFPPNLKRLTLTNTFLEWKHMSTLAKIDTLEVLKLKHNAFIGTYWNAMDDCFRQLQLLVIVRTGLVIWEASNKSFPKLECLVLKHCENLDEIPLALAETLQKLDIERVRQSAVDSANKIAEIKRAREHGTSKSRFPFTLNIGPVYLG